MQAQTTKMVGAKAMGAKAKTGRAIFWLGTLVFMVESWLLIGQVAKFWQGSGAATLGWIAAIGAIVQKVLSVLTWNQGLLLATLAKVLVLCCPLLVIAVGFSMMRGANYAKASETAGESATAKEERR
jgi:hypothetical protein